MYFIATNPARNLVRTTFSGFPTVEEVAEHGRLEQETVRQMGLRSFEYYALIDARPCSTLSQEVATALHDAFHRAAIKPRRVAVVRTKLQGQQMQARRIADDSDRVAVFSDFGEAEAWLFETEKGARITRK